MIYKFHPLNKDNITLINYAPFANNYQLPTNSFLTPRENYVTFSNRGDKMRKIDIQKSLRHLEKIRRLMSKARSPYKNMTKQQIIDEIRKTRQKLWEEKLVTHSR